MGRNSYFQFKQFTIRQENAAMKVGTDGVLLGAWTSVENVSSVLDIGTGTGLIALMLAQRNKARIVAIDKELSAFHDAELNACQSPWRDRITVLHQSFQEFVASPDQCFDSIVCNPPFFANSYKPSDGKRAVARHNDELPFGMLVEGVSKLLKSDGHFSVILPATTENEFRMMASDNRLFPSRITRVKPKPSASATRVLMEFKHEAILEIENELTIETERHHDYLPEFIELVKDFYLKL